MPYCAEYWGGQRCASAEDPNCLGTVIRGLDARGTNTCRCVPPSRRAAS
jgi:hypothetical protein